MKSILSAVLMIFLAFGASAETDRVWIDVRTAAEYSEGHLKGAENIPHDQIAEKVEELGLDASTPIGVYCRSGRRAGIAKETLEAMGYTDVLNARDLDTARSISDGTAQGGD